jgi:DNA-binding LytR/AlgR family response regulator
MPKAIIIVISSDNATIDSVLAESVITWFDIQNFSTISCQKRKWTGNALISKNDENVAILLPDDDYYIVGIESIVRVENRNSESNFFLNNGDFFTTPTPFSIVVEQLKAHQFFLIHPSHLINIKHLKTFVQCNAFVTLSNSDAVPVSIGNDQKIVDFLNKQTIF